MDKSVLIAVNIRGSNSDSLVGHHIPVTRVSYFISGGRLYLINKLIPLSPLVFIAVVREAFPHQNR